MMRSTVLACLVVLGMASQISTGSSLSHDVQSVGGENMAEIVTPDKWAVLTIIGESASEPIEGQIAVANVIRNRMKRKYSSDGTVIGTVLRRKQFSMWDDRARTYAATRDEDSPEVWMAVEAWNRSIAESPVGDAVLYHTVDVHPYWADASGVEKIKRVGRHIFYRDKNGA